MITSTSPYIHSQLAQGLAPAISSISSTAKEDSLPRSQIALVLQGLRQPYTITPAHPVPLLSYPDELMIKIQAIGLNPIDWKSVYVPIYRVYLTKLTCLPVTMASGFPLSLTLLVGISLV